MTSLAFGFGVLPLAVATGAGAGAQNAIGTSVLGGMVTATVLVIIFAPLFYVLIEMLLGKGRQSNRPLSSTAKTFFTAIIERLSKKRGSRGINVVQEGNPEV